MKITAKLAYKQLKINKIRTIWTLIGIILSTALITAILSFAASGNALVTSILGSDYGEYKDILSGLFVIPIIILGLIIISMSIIVISNSFRVSAGERRLQFGILKSVGATKKQILSTVIYESIILSIIAIPIGIIIGLILAYLGVEVANYFLIELNSLVHIMMNEFSIVLDFIVSIKAIIVACLISLVTVIISAGLPGMKAAKTTAIDSIRDSEEIKLDNKSLKVSPIIYSIFGFEGVLAFKNFKRSRKNLRASIISITIGIVLFINLASLNQQAKMMEKMLYPDIDSTVIVDYMSELDEDKYDLILNPINSLDADKIFYELAEFEDANLMGVGYDMETYNALIPNEYITDEMKMILETKDLKNEELQAEIIVLDPISYRNLCDKIEVEVGSNILLNYYSYNDNGIEKYIEPFIYEDGDLELITKDKIKDKITIDKVIVKEDVPKELFAPNTGIVRIIVPKAETRGYMWLADPTDIDGFVEYANNVINNNYPEVKDSEYMELGYTTRVYKLNDYMKVMNIAIVLAMVFVYSFVILLIMIGFTNVISTMSTNVYVRHKEFAVLQSVGMTFKGLTKMINLESMLISIKALSIGIPIGILTSYLINRPIRAKFPIPYSLPIRSILICLILVFSVTFFIMKYSIGKIKSNNIIETIRF